MSLFFFIALAKEAMDTRKSWITYTNESNISPLSTSVRDEKEVAAEVSRIHLLEPA
jgi:hypothetical protein